MDRRINANNEIQFCFSFLITRVKRAGKLNFTDVHIVAEDFFKFLLNKIYRYELKNSNAVVQNDNAIDLYFKKERICYQITSQNKPAKIKESVDGFIKSNKYNEYSKFVILSISDGKKCNSDALSDLIQYNTIGEYINVTDLERSILFDLETDRLEEIAEYLKYETNPLYQKKTDKLNEEDEIRKLKTLHIVDQLLFVLKQFDGLKSIYPRTIAQLYPFNSSRRNFDVYSHYCLKTDNLQIHQLLQKIKINSSNEIVISDNTLEPYRNEIKQIFTILNHSLVRCICYKEKYTEVEHHNICVIHYDSNCNCNYCKYYKFNTKELFSLIKEKSLKPSDDFQDAMNEGYFMAKLGEHVKSYGVFNHIATESLKNKKFISNYIANQNLKKIRNFIDVPWLESESRAILPTIDEIDLDDKLCSYSLTKNVKEELIKLKENYYLDYSREEIEEYVRKISDIFNLYKRNGSQSGSEVVKLLWEELHILHSFYISNSILLDDFYSFRETISKGIEGVFISYATDKSYKQRYRGLDSFILKLIVFYTQEDSLKAILDQYQIDNICILEKEKDTFVKIFSNFFESQISNVAFGDIRFNEDLSKQEYFSHYRQNLRHYFNKVMLLLAKLERIDNLKSIIDPIINYLKGTEDLNNRNFDYFALFFENQSALFTTIQLEQLFEILFIKCESSISNNNLNSICRIASDNLNFRISNESIFQKIYQSVLIRFNDTNRLNDKEQLLALYRVTNDKNKLLVKNISIEYLNTDFNPNFYELACFYNIFNKDEYPDFLNSYLDFAEKQCTPFDYKQEGDKWIAQSFTGINCIICFKHLNIDFSHLKIQALSKKSDYYNWLINPKTFDYTNFNKSWLSSFMPIYLRKEIKSIEPLKNFVLFELEKKYDSELAKLLFTSYN